MSILFFYNFDQTWNYLTPREALPFNFNCTNEKCKKRLHHSISTSPFFACHLWCLGMWQESKEERVKKLVLYLDDATFTCFPTLEMILRIKCHVNLWNGKYKVWNYA
jgi:hypothetical protein